MRSIAGAGDADTVIRAAMRMALAIVRIPVFILRSGIALAL
jgi:hypothetical protein